MSTSPRARRMARNHKRMAGQPKLNLVALMDIFTILVLFLIVNNGDVEVLQSDRNITLPESVSEHKPELALTIKITSDDVIVEDLTVERIDTVLAQPEMLLTGLGEELQRRASLASPLSEQEEAVGRPVIIMGDQGTPYALLKRVMATCAQSGYRDISLAVNSKPPAPGVNPALASQEG
ncbi:MAG: biopolymer transporter ExbD [Halioglobus sp.]